MRIAALGDSLTYGYGVRRKAAWPHLLAEALRVPVDNYGISGDTTGGMLARFSSQVLPDNPTHLILMGGGNDLIMGLDPVIPAANLRTIIYQAVQNRIVVMVGLPILPCEKAKQQILLPPSEFPQIILGRKQIENRLRGFSESGLFHLLDFQEFIEGEEDVYLDGLHLNEKGNRLIAERLIPYFQK